MGFLSLFFTGCGHYNRSRVFTERKTIKDVSSDVPTQQVIVHQYQICMDCGKEMQPLIRFDSVTYPKAIDPKVEVVCQKPLDSPAPVVV